ncbi:MAG: amidohydrolase family protein [Deltaproteobacteria bacterium]|nr:amidohydrolase family protein [Deltaproteobacteria bacterium]
MIDAHMHIFPSYRSVKAVRWIKRYIPHLRVEETISEEDIIQVLECSKVSHFVNYVYPINPDETRSLNEYNYRLSKRVRNAICFGSIHPANANPEEIIEEAIYDLDLIGLKFYPFVQGFDVLDPRMDKVYKKMEKINRPVVIHTGFDKFYGSRILPEDIEKILREYPDLVVVIAHMFYPLIGEAFRIIREYDNVYLDGTNIFSDYREPQSGENIFDGRLVKDGDDASYRVYFHHSLEELEKYSHRIFAGTDYPVGMNDPEEIYAHIRSLKISEDAGENIMNRSIRDFIEQYKPNYFGSL